MDKTTHHLLGMKNSEVCFIYTPACGTSDPEECYSGHSDQRIQHKSSVEDATPNFESAQNKNGSEFYIAWIIKNDSKLVGKIIFSSHRLRSQLYLGQENKKWSSFSIGGTAAYP